MAVNPFKSFDRSTHRAFTRSPHKARNSPGCGCCLARCAYKVIQAQRRIGGLVNNVNDDFAFGLPYCTVYKSRDYEETFSSGSLNAHIAFTESCNPFTGVRQRVYTATLDPLGLINTNPQLSYLRYTQSHGGSIIYDTDSPLGETYGIIAWHGATGGGGTITGALYDPLDFSEIPRLMDTLLDEGSYDELEWPSLTNPQTPLVAARSVGKHTYYQRLLLGYNTDGSISRQTFQDEQLTIAKQYGPLGEGHFWGPGDILTGYPKFECQRGPSMDNFGIFPFVPIVGSSLIHAVTCGITAGDQILTSPDHVLVTCGNYNPNLNETRTILWKIYPMSAGSQLLRSSVERNRAGGGLCNPGPMNLFNCTYVAQKLRMLPYLDDWSRPDWMQDYTIFRRQFEATDGCKIYSPGGIIQELPENFFQGTYTGCSKGGSINVLPPPVGFDGYDVDVNASLNVARLYPCCNLC
jgi:hypothetical protein